MLKLPKANLLKFPTSIYFVTIFLIVLLALVYLVYEVHKQLKISAKKDFIGTVSANLISADQSLDELKNSLFTASNSYQTFIKEDEKFQKINFTETLENNAQNLSQIETVANSLVFQKDLVKDSKVPKDYDELKIGFLAYYDKSSEVLENLQEDFNAENQIYQVLNSNLGNINIYNDELWQYGQTEDILIFYQNLKNAANNTLQELLSLEVSRKYEDYYNLHISYLENLIASANEVINSLEIESKDLIEIQPNQLEIAHNSANDSKNKLNKILNDIKEERKRYFSQSTPLNNFDNLSRSQEKLEDQIKNLYQQLFVEARQKLIEF